MALTSVNTQNLVSKLLLGFVATLIVLPLFWLSGGGRWMETQVFPPTRPRSLPANAVWIEAPALPISWHHGWWFGCDISPKGTTNLCRLVENEGRVVYAGEYLPCGDKSPVPLSSIALVPPTDSIDMWIADERLRGLAPAGFLQTGDILFPIFVLDQCDKFKVNLRH